MKNYNALKFTNPPPINNKLYATKLFSDERTPTKEKKYPIKTQSQQPNSYSNSLQY